MALQFMKATKITDANLVANHFPEDTIYRHKSIQITNVNLVAIYFLKQEVWRSTLTGYMKTKNILNVNLVANHLLQQYIWRNICIPFMKAIKILNVNHVVNHLLVYKSWRTTSIQFMMNMITNVNIVVNHFHIHTPCRNTLRKFMKASKSKPKSRSNISLLMILSYFHFLPTVFISITKQHMNSWNYISKYTKKKKHNSIRIIWYFSSNCLFAWVNLSCMDNLSLFNVKIHLRFGGSFWVVSRPDVDHFDFRWLFLVDFLTGQIN